MRRRPRPRNSNTGCEERSLRPARALLCGALVVGALDAIDAIVFFGLRGASPTRIFQSVAGGLLGRSTYRGGVATALLGVLLHFCVALSIVAVYFVASKRVRVLTRHPVRCGLVYGLLAHLVMSFVVVPLSAAGKAPFSLPVMLNGLIGHAFLVGLPSALFARAATVPKVSIEALQPRINYAACVWALVFAAPHLWWTLGISIAFAGGEASYRSFMSSLWRYLFDVVVVLLSFTAAVVALALVRPWGSRIPRWIPRAAAWIASAMLTLRGVAGLVVDGSSDLIWWPTFLTGGVLFGSVAWVARTPARLSADDCGIESGTGS